MPAVPTPLATAPLPPASGLSPVISARKAKADEEKSVNGAVVQAQLPERTVNGAGVVITIKKAYAAAALAMARANLPIITAKRAPQPARPRVKKELTPSVLVPLSLRKITNAPTDTPVLAYVTAPKANLVSAQSFIVVVLASFITGSYHDCDDSDNDLCSEYSNDKDAVGQLAPSPSAETIIYTDIQAIFNALPLACATSSMSTSPPVSIKSAAIKGTLGSVTGTPPIPSPSRLGNVQRIDYRTYKCPSTFWEYREKKDKENTIHQVASARIFV
ncbi:hypothetical protein C8R43DRAFT_1171990 [Mycena crocata]|nr:hypothetical protein C8R43DRAFT_1171990 [Mycena crocata]